MNDFTDYFHILNPNRQNRGAVKRFFRKVSADYYCWVERTSHPTHVETLVEWALREGRNKIAVWGGDGTLSRVAQELYRLEALEKMAVALIPVGSANDFARKLGLADWRKSAGELSSDNLVVKTFDLGLVHAGGTSRIFVNNSGFGRKKAALDRAKSNPFKDILNFDVHKLQVEWKTEHVTQYETIRAILGIVFNGPFFNNGMYFNQDIAPDDGMLTAYFAPPQGKWGLFKKFLRSRLGGSLNDDKTLRMDAEMIEVESDQEMFPQADGEPVTKGGVEEIKYSILKGVFRMIAPTVAGQP
jgi:diacylglycerol kinase family enzyme